MFCCFNARCYTLLFVLCFIVGFGQSKKEQIAFLTHQKDSLLMALQIQKDVYSNDLNVLKNKNNSLEQQLELITTEKNKLIIQQNTNKAEIVKLQSTITSLDKKYDALLLQSKASYAMIAKLNRKIDSLSNVGFGTPLVESGRVSLTFVNCIDGYLLNKNTIELPIDSDIVKTDYTLNGMTTHDIVFPIGWSAEGLFMYNWINCYQVCNYGTNIFDVNKNKIIISTLHGPVMTGDDELYKGKNNDSCDRLYVNYNQFIKKYNITPISNLKMNYLQSKNGIITLQNMAFFIEQNKNIAQLVVLKNGQKHIIKQQILESHYDYNSKSICENYILLNGCFLNPLNKKQIVFHVFQAEPCGFENDTYLESEFASYILSD